MDKLLIAYTVVTRERDNTKHWIRIGQAHVDPDGQIVVRLDAIPMNGEVLLRSAQPNREGR